MKLDKVVDINEQLSILSNPFIGILNETKPNPYAIKISSDSFKPLYWDSKWNTLQNYLTNTKKKAFKPLYWDSKWNPSSYMLWGIRCMFIFPFKPLYWDSKWNVVELNTKFGTRYLSNTFIGILNETFWLIIEKN